MRASTPGDTPPPQSGASREHDATSRERRPASARARDGDRGASRGGDQPADRGAGSNYLTPRERAERWPLG